MLNPEKIWHEILRVCPPHLSDVATLPWEIQKSYFQQYYSYILLIIYVMLSQKKKKNNNNNDRLTAFDPGQPLTPTLH